ncbi:MAG: 4-hydroxy-tetrahydrodipicolinate reductase [Myxococcota bacterium]|nr:4-hydroxy-tetrahydrodipicolinate reductase [Myxococcota bacterium]
MIRVGINGAAGRMGQLLCARIIAHPQLDLSGATDRPDFAGKDVGEMVGLGPLGRSIEVLSASVFEHCDVVIDFSLPEGTTALIPVLRGQALVVGTTGLDEAGAMAVGEYGQQAPVVLAANFSTGVNVLLELVVQAAKLLPSADIDIVEMHHSRKKDAPSGTALALAKAVCDARYYDADESLVFGRAGDSGPRPSSEVAVHAVRGGDVAGDHTVILASQGERLELKHIASNRGSFADGALNAAVWATQQAPGLYNMKDVLGL